MSDNEEDKNKNIQQLEERIIPTEEDILENRQSENNNYNEEENNIIQTEMAEISSNYNSSFDEDKDFHFTIENKEEKKSFFKTIYNFFDENAVDVQNYNKKKKIILGFILLCVITNFVLKIILSISIWKWAFKPKDDLKEKIFEEMFNEPKGFKRTLLNIVFYFNRSNLFFGVLSFNFHSALEVVIKFYFLLFSKDKRISFLFLNKIIFFLCLGTFPELLIEMFNFKNQNNYIIKVFVSKLIVTPFFSVISLIYFLFLIKKLYPKEERYERLKNHFNQYMDLFNSISKSNLFEWNTIDNLYYDKENINNSYNQDNEEDKLKESEEKEEEKKEEKEEEKKEESNTKTMVHEVFYDLFLVKINSKYIMMGLLFISMIIPLANGIFGYGYLVFYRNEEYLKNIYFQLDILFSIIFGYCIIVLSK